MPCLLAALALFFPRIVILLLYFFTDFFVGVFDSALLALIGFVFLPLTLLAYAWLTKMGYPMDAFFLIVVGVAVIIDLGLVGGGAWSRGKRS